MSEMYQNHAQRIRFQTRMTDNHEHFIEVSKNGIGFR